MRRKLIAVYVFLIIMLFCNCVYATFDADLVLVFNKNKVKAGDTITVTLQVTKITGTDKGVENIEGYINIDENIFEPITANNIVTDSDGKVVIGNMKLDLEDLTNTTSTDNLKENTVVFNGKPISGNDSKVIIDLPTPLTEDTDILTLNFKVKEDAEIGYFEKAISYDMFVIYSGEEKTVSASAELEITVEEGTQDPDDCEHDWVKNTEKSKPATCTEDGYDFYECSKCGETKTETIKATGHHYGDWEITKEATTTEEGQRQRKCEDCGHIETESIPKLESNEDENSSDNEENKEDENNNGAANNNNNNNNNGTPGDVTDKTTANKTLPAAGLKTMFLPAVILVAIAVVSYRKYIKYKDI